MPSHEDEQRVIGHYTRLLEQHGRSPRALDWGSRDSQYVRFEALTGIAPLQGCRILDVGCGLADLLDYLQGRRIDVVYKGCDITPAMLEEASRRFPGIDVSVGDVLEKDFEGQFDYVLASGIFTFLGENAQQLMQQLIAKMFKLSTGGVAFNSLSTWAKHRETGEFCADPLETVAFCQTLTSRVVLRHDYMPHDFTIYLYHELKTT